MGANERGASGVALALAIVVICAAAATLALWAPAARAAGGSGAIAGTVRAASTHEALPGIDVVVYEASGDGFPVGFARTKANGEYVVEGLATGSYKVEFSAGFESGNYAPQFYREASSLSGATIVTVFSGQPPTAEINAELQVGGKIRGTVTEAGSATALSGIGVVVYEAGGSGAPVGFATTGANGEYTVEDLASGSYKVEFSAGIVGSPFEESAEGEFFEPEGITRQNFVTQYYRNAASLQAATPISVTQGETTAEVNAAMQHGGEIEGTVVDASTHAPVADVSVAAFAPGEVEASFATTEANGHYTLAGLESGSYVVAFAASHYIAQFYAGQTSFARANAVTVVRPNATPAINAALVLKAPVNAVAPVASGTPAVGQTLSCAPGTWTGSPAPSYAYAWLRDGVAITGANAPTYAVQSADQGNGVTCKVTATNRNGTGTAISNTLVVPVPSPPPPPPPIPALRVATSHVLVRDGSARVALQCAQARCAGTLELVERLAVKRRHHRTRYETVVLGAASYALQAGQDATVTVKLSAKGRHAVAHARHHRLQAEALATVAGGTSAKQAVVLSADRHR